MLYPLWIAMHFYEELINYAMKMERDIASKHLIYNVDLPQVILSWSIPSRCSKWILDYATSPQMCMLYVSSNWYIITMNCNCIVCICPYNRERLSILVPHFVIQTCIDHLYLISNDTIIFISLGFFSLASFMSFCELYPMALHSATYCKSISMPWLSKEYSNQQTTQAASMINCLMFNSLS